MLTKKIVSLLLSAVLTITVTQVINSKNAFAATSVSANNVVRIQGGDRFKTSRSIAEVVNNSTSLDNIVLASGQDFPDGLSGSTLAKKLNAPLLMAGNLEDSKEAFGYISDHLKQNGNIYILGGTGAVGQDTENALVQKGYKVTRIYGQDRFETNNSVVDNLKVEEGTPVFIANGYGFADALSASSIAAIKGYPLLLTNTNELPDLVKTQLAKIKPSKVYIVGGVGVVSNNVLGEISSIVPSAEMSNLGGPTRYETSMNVYRCFNLDTKNVVLASGKNFPDALSGSQLAAKLNASLVLSDEDNLGTQQAEFSRDGLENFYLLGGNGALSNNVELCINFNEETEKENIKALYNKAAQAVKNKNIDNYMATVDESSPAYENTKKVYQQLFQYMNENNLDIDPNYESYNFISVSFNSATVEVVELDTLTDNNSKTTENDEATTTSTLKRVNGQWKFSSTTISQ